MELYINKQLCDLGGMNKNILFKRVFINPSELSTKDAQKSYEFELPTTDRNNRIFGFKNVEEVQGKFVEIYDAYLVIGGVKVFDGKFRMSQITRDYYKGNLGVPHIQTIKEIFGEQKMSEAGEWNVSFKGFPESINEYNNTPNPPCFFPYVLYGLLPKTSREDGIFSDKDIWDNTAVVSLDDFPPSINCLEAIRNIFKSKEFTITGTAFNDERLTKLYMSYKNPTEYELPWNYRGLIDLELIGNLNIEDEKVYINEEKMVANYDMIKARRPSMRPTPVVNKGYMYDRGIITIPVSGVYEVELDAEITLNDGKDWTGNSTGTINGLNYIRIGQDLYLLSGTTFDELADLHSFEVKLLRYTDSDFNPSDIEIDRKFGKPNLYQDNKEWEYESYFPKLFPQPNKTMLIDPSQNDRFLIGLGFGKDDLPEEAKAFYTSAPNPMILANGWSWNPQYSQDEENYITSGIEGYLEATFENNIVSLSKSDVNKKIIDNFTPNDARFTNDQSIAKGNVKAYVYLKKGEKLTVVSSSTVTYDGALPKHIRAHSIDYRLKIKPIMFDKTFVNYITDASDNGINEISDMLKENINLIKFLPTEIKINDWLDNFCKAFNLSLTQTSLYAFELNTKQTKDIAKSSLIIDLHKKTNVELNRVNTSLNLPSAYEIGFTINKEEQGFIESGDDGGGNFLTGNTSNQPLKQTSNFSYNWLKEITYEDNEGDKKIMLPVITDKEVWAVEGNRDYLQMMQKTYTNSAQRFWYKGDNFSIPYYWDDGSTLDIALVTNSTKGMDLNYKDRPASILKNYFTIFVNNNTNYTEVRCYLTPEEYSNINNSLIQLNGDLYYIAEIDGYDPLGKNKATLKLIRKVL